MHRQLRRGLVKHDIDGLAQNSSISSVLAMEILQFCTKPSLYSSSDSEILTMSLDRSKICENSDVGGSRAQGNKKRLP